MRVDTDDRVSAAYDTIEALNLEISMLVAERQSLRAADADRDALERNRLEICGLQRRLAYALIARYLPAPAQAA
jgi:FtsZ-binding cell division protein ZapB